MIGANIGPNTITELSRIRQRTPASTHLLLVPKMNAYTFPDERPGERLHSSITRSASSSSTA